MARRAAQTKVENAGQDEGVKDGAPQEGAPEKPKTKDVPKINVTDAIILSVFNQITKLNKAKDKAVKNIRDYRKDAKGKGVNLKVIDAMIVLANREISEEEFRAEHNESVIYMRAIGLIHGDQLDLLADDNTPITEPERVRDARKLGDYAARQGKSLSDNPHNPNTAVGQGWMEGWHQGHQKNLDALEVEMARRNSEQKTAGAEKETADA